MTVHVSKPATDLAAVFITRLAQALPAQHATPDVQRAVVLACLAAAEVMPSLRRMPRTDAATTLAYVEELLASEPDGVDRTRLEGMRHHLKLGARARGWGEGREAASWTNGPADRAARHGVPGHRS